jgi:hypothetical protein
MQEVVMAEEARQAHGVADAMAVREVRSLVRDLNERLAEFARRGFRLEVEGDDGHYVEARGVKNYTQFPRVIVRVYREVGPAGEEAAGEAPREHEPQEI